MATRIALYSHDSAGLGHIRRNLALAHALSAGMDDVTGILIAGRPEATRFTPPQGWDWLILPSIHHADGGYDSRDLDVDFGTITAIRGGVVASALRAFAPDLVVIDRHPFGVGGELNEALRMLRRELPSCRVVLGLRDVLDAPEVADAEWRALGGAVALREALDAIWVYGDPVVHDTAASGEIPVGVRDLVQHTGLLAHGRVDGSLHEVETPILLTTVGGGIDGVEIAVAAAAAPVPAGYHHLVVTGPQMPREDRRRVIAAAAPGTTVVRRVPDVLPLIRRASAVVCMGGYNTACEVLATDTPALMIPRAHRRAEQRIRANALASLGAVETMSPWTLTSEAIGEWFAAAVDRTVDREHLALDGLSRVPELAADLLDAARGESLRVAS